MFDFLLFFLLLAISIPGLVATIPQQMESVRKMASDPGKPGRKSPSPRTLIVISFFQNLILVAVAAGIGTALAQQVGYTTPLYTAIRSGSPPIASVVAGMLPAVVISAVAVIPFLIVYYGLVRPRLDRDTVIKVEGLRMALGIPARILYGGIVEEVLFRWGLMTLLTWAGFAFLADGSQAVVWGAILASGLLFGLGHLPGISATGAAMNRTLMIATIILNLYAGVLFGWLYWKYGLGAAILGHMIFHLVWLPLDVRSYHKTLAGAAPR